MSEEKKVHPDIVEAAESGNYMAMDEVAMSETENKLTAYELAGKIMDIKPSTPLKAEMIRERSLSIIRFAESYAKEEVKKACKAQRGICASRAKAHMETVLEVDGNNIRPVVDKDTILNAPSPTLRRTL